MKHIFEKYLKPKLNATIISSQLSFRILLTNNLSSCSQIETTFYTIATTHFTKIYSKQKQNIRYDKKMLEVVLLFFEINKIPTEYIKTGHFHKQNNCQETIKQYENNSTIIIAKVLLIPFSLEPLRCSTICKKKTLTCYSRLFFQVTFWSKGLKNKHFVTVSLNILVPTPTAICQLDLILYLLIASLVNHCYRLLSKKLY